MAVKIYNTEMIEKIKKNLDDIRSEADNYFGNNSDNYIGIQRHEQKDATLKFILMKIAQMQTEIDELRQRLNSNKKLTKKLGGGKIKHAPYKPALIPKDK